MSFTVQDVLDETIRVAKSNPDFVYWTGEPSARCSYLGKSREDPTGQCCIVGQALKNLKVDTSKLYELEVNTNSSVTIGEAIQRKFIDIDTSYEGARKDVNWLVNVQVSQDTGNSWGEAIQG